LDECLNAASEGSWRRPPTPLTTSADKRARRRRARSRRCRVNPEQRGPPLSEDFDHFMSAVDLAAAIRRKDVSPAEVAAAYLERIDELDPGLNAFCHRDDGLVGQAARRATDAVARARSSDELPPF